MLNISQPKYLTCVGSACENPGSGGFGRLEESLAQHFLQLGLQLEVGLAALDGEQQLGQLQTPLPGEELQDEVWSGVVGQPHVLRHKEHKRNLYQQHVDSGEVNALRRLVAGQQLIN